MLAFWMSIFFRMKCLSCIDVELYYICSEVHPEVASVFLILDVWFDWSLIKTGFTNRFIKIFKNHMFVPERRIKRMTKIIHNSFTKIIGGNIFVYIHTILNLLSVFQLWGHNIYIILFFDYSFHILLMWTIFMSCCIL